MKKLAVVQIALGLLIIVSSIYWVGCLSSGYHDREGITPDGTIIHSLPLLAPNPAFDVWSVLYPVLGLVILGCGIAQYFEKGAKRMAAAQIVLGVLNISSLVWFICWVEWDYGPYTFVTEQYGEIKMKLLPGWEIKLIVWKIISFILSLSVVGAGVVQLIKTKGQ